LHRIVLAVVSEWCQTVLEIRALALRRYELEVRHDELNTSLDN
jgi:hypothetical protein